jgi:prevent-host-death family protein
MQSVNFEVVDDSYSLTSARARLGELVSRARYSHRPVAITEHGKPSVAIINIDDLADLEDRAALAAHYAARLAGLTGVPLAELDAALDRMDADDARFPFWCAAGGALDVPFPGSG